jgi:hypothetical protein
MNCKEMTGICELDQGETRIRIEGDTKYVYCPTCISRHTKEIEIIPVLDMGEFERMFK